MMGYLRKPLVRNVVIATWTIFFVFAMYVGGFVSSYQLQLKIQHKADLYEARFASREHEISPEHEIKLSDQIKVLNQQISRSQHLAEIAIASDFSPWSFFTWLLGSIWSRPKNFERPEGAYLTLKLRTPDRLKSILGPTVIVDPSNRLGQMCEAGIKVYSLADFGWTTDADVDFHKSRDTCVEKATVEVSFNPQTKSIGNVTKKFILWREEFEHANGAEIRVFPPRSVAPDVADEWKKVVQHSEETGDIIILTVTVYVERPVKIKGSQSFQVFVCPTMTLAKIMGYKKDGDGLGVALMDAKKQEDDRTRQEKGINIQILAKKDNTLRESRSASIAIYDSLGEVYRGEVEDGTQLKVVPEGKANLIRVYQLENEVPLTMEPRTAIDPKTGKMLGFVSVVERSQILFYPQANHSSVAVSGPFNGEIKIYAPKGTKVNLTAIRSGHLVGRQDVVINSFGGAIIPVQNAHPMTITAMVAGKKFTREMNSQNSQVTFDFENKEPVRNYSQININPAVRGGIHTKVELRQYAATLHFQQNLAAIETNPIEIEELRKAATSGKVGYVIVGPEDRYVQDSYGTWKVHTLVKGLTECGPNGQPLPHKAYYNIRFDKYVKAWVAPGRYGWVPAILVDCGNATMVYIPPPTTIALKPELLPSLSFAPSSEIPLKVSWDDLSISVAKIAQGNFVITPSSISSYVPQAKTDIKLSMRQSQNQSQNQNQDQTSVNTNINDNTTIINNDINVNIPIDINNNNINQQNTVVNGANANN